MVPEEVQVAVDQGSRCAICNHIDQASRSAICVHWHTRCAAAICIDVLGRVCSEHLWTHCQRALVPTTTQHKPWIALAQCFCQMVSGRPCHMNRAAGEHLSLSGMCLGPDPFTSASSDGVALGMSTLGSALVSIDPPANGDRPSC